MNTKYVPCSGVTYATLNISWTLTHLYANIFEPIDFPFP